MRVVKRKRKGAAVIQLSLCTCSRLALGGVVEIQQSFLARYKEVVVSTDFLDHGVCDGTERALEAYVGLA